MTDFRNQDPRMRDVDPRANDPRANDFDEQYTPAGSRTPWGWIAGAIAVFLVLAVIFSWGRGGPQTADTNVSPPASTTGMAPPPNPRPPIATPPAASASPTAPAPTGQPPANQ
jgi:hypothetical protein